MVGAPMAASAAAIEIRRKTSQGTKLVDYASGSVLTEDDLDTDSDQAFFMSQEAIDEFQDKNKTFKDHLVCINTSLTEKDSLIEQLRDVLNDLSDKERYQSEADQSDAQQRVISKVPLNIYIG